MNQWSRNHRPSNKWKLQSGRSPETTRPLMIWQLCNALPHVDEIHAHRNRKWQLDSLWVAANCWSICTATALGIWQWKRNAKIWFASHVVAVLRGQRMPAEEGSMRKTKCEGTVFSTSRSLIMHLQQIHQYTNCMIEQWDKQGGWLSHDYFHTHVLSQYGSQWVLG